MIHAAMPGRVARRTFEHAAPRRRRAGRLRSQARSCQREPVRPQASEQQLLLLSRARPSRDFSRTRVHNGRNGRRLSDETSYRDPLANVGRQRPTRGGQLSLTYSDLHRCCTGIGPSNLNGSAIGRGEGRETTIGIGSWAEEADLAGLSYSLPGSSNSKDGSTSESGRRKCRRKGGHSRRVSVCRRN